MTIDELKNAFATGCAVLHKKNVATVCSGAGEGIVYARVSAIIYRKTKSGETLIQAELSDRKWESITIASPKDIEFAH